MSTSLSVPPVSSTASSSSFSSPSPSPSALPPSSSSCSTYTFPPIYSFPPFFTLQRNEQTLASQLQLWSRFILDYCTVKRLFVLDADASAGDRDGGELFRNETIGRALDATARRRVLKQLVDDGKAAWVGIAGSGIGGSNKVWGLRGGIGGGGSSGSSSTADDKVGDRILVFWKRPDEWGEIIHQWVVATGQNRSIMTFFELTEGDLVQETEFRGMPLPLLRLALATLEKTGRAKVFEGSESGDSMTGVKFA